MSGQLRVDVGTDRQWPVRCWLDGGSTPAAFGASDTLAAYVFRGQDQAQLFTLATAPYTGFDASTGADANGYAGGYVNLTITAANSATLEAGGTYPVRIDWTPQGSSFVYPVWHGELYAEPAAGTSTQAINTYCSYQDMLQYAPWLRQIEDQDTDQEGFYTQRLQARKWLDWLIVKAWRGGAWGVFGDASRPASEWSGWGMWRTPLPSPYLIQMLAGGFVQQIGAVTITSPGTGYTSITVTAPNPPGSGQPPLWQPATFTPSLSGGGLGALVVGTPGAGYTPGSTLALNVSGNGTGAAATAKVSAGTLIVRDQVIRLCAWKAISLVGTAQIQVGNTIYAGFGQYWADRLAGEWQQTVAELDINGDGLADLAIPLGRANTIYE